MLTSSPWAWASAIDAAMTTRRYWIYIMTNRSGTLYIGITGDLARRVYEHRNHLLPGFTSRYHIDRLVYAEGFSEVRDAIAREKQLKGWSRAQKIALIAESNPQGRDLGEEWFGPSEAK
jgi:putative endonuclease